MNDSRPNPYPGPRSFQQGERLFGRQRETAALLDLLIAERVVLLYSPSGAGKTSLVQAALAPALAAEGFRVLPIMRPGLTPDQPAPGANRYVLSLLLGLEATRPEDAQTSLAELAGLTLADYLDRLPAPAEGVWHGDVLLFDQFEEILTADPTDRAAKLACFEQIGQALRDRNRWALFAMREEFVAALDPYLRPIPARFDKGRRYRLDLLSPDAARQAMQGPAEDAGVAFTDEAAIRLADDLRRTQVQQPDGAMVTALGPHIEPVQLQVVCRRLWDNLAPDDAVIDSENLVSVGDVNTTLRGYYADTVAAVAAQTGVRERAVREWADRQLITEAGIRGQVLMGQGTSQGLPNAAIWPLVDSHLVRAEGRRGATWFELAHDRLIEPVRGDNAEWAAAHLSAMQRQAKLWHEQGRSDGLLLSGEALVEAEAWAAARTELLEPHERNFLAACRKARERVEREKRQSRRIRVLAMVAGVVAVLTIVAASIAIDRTHKAELAKQEAQQQAKTAKLQRLGVQSRSNLDSNYDLALLLSLEVDGSGINTVEAGGNLAETLEHSPQIQYFLRGHDAPVISVAFDSNGDRLASGDEQGRLILWDLTAVPPAPRTLIDHGQPVQALSFVSAQNALVSLSYAYHADSSTEAFVWNAKNGDKVRQLSLPKGDSTERAALSHDGGTIALVTNKTTVTLWNVFEDALIGVPARIAEPSVFSWVDGLAFSPDATKLALWLSARENSGIILWDTAKQQIVGQPRPEHANTVSALTFSPDGRLLASSSYDGSTYLWDVESWKPIYRFPEARKWSSVENGRGLAFSPDGQTLVTGDHKGTVTFWDATNPQPLFISLQGREDDVSALAFGRDGHWLASGGQDGAIILWELDKTNRMGQILADFQPSPITWSLGPDGRTIAVSAFMSGEIALLDPFSGKPAGRPMAGSSDIITGLAFHPNEPLLAASTTDYARIQVMFWDIENRKPSREPLSQDGYDAYDLRYNFNGSILAFREEFDGRVYLYDAHTLTSIEALRPPIDDQYSVVDFGPKSNVLATGTLAGQVALWDIASFQPLWQSKDTAAMTITSLAFAPDQTMISVGGAEGDIALLASRTGKVLRWLRNGHGGSAVNQLAFAPDGKILASGGDDNTIVLWNVASGTPVARFQAPYKNGVEKLAFAPQGDTLFSSGDGVLTRWDLDSTSWRTLACQIAGRNLSIEEWKLYIGPETPYRLTCPSLPPHPSVLRAAIENSAELIVAGQEEPAVTQIEKALQLAGKTDGDLRVEAQRLLAVLLVERAESMAKQGDLKEAIAFYEIATRLDRMIDLVPEAEAKRVYVEVLMADGEWAAMSGDVERAVARFREAIELDPSLKLNPIEHATQLYNDALGGNIYDRVMAMAIEGDIDGAIAEVERTLMDHPSLDIPGTVWNRLCWSGSLVGRATDVLQACDRAIASIPESGNFRDSRGLARALTGDVQGAIEDFEFALEIWKTKNASEEHITSRAAWVEALRQGKDPVEIFDAATLEQLRNNE